jgi:hypothetical protein
MNEFSAIVTNEQKIIVTTNTYWSCKAEGNFKLSQYDGSGDTVINVIIPEDILSVEGVVYFTYGDERCTFPYVTILFNNSCYIKTMPSYTACTTDNGEVEKIIYLFFNEEKEVFNLSVFCIGNWEVRNNKHCIYLARGSELMIVSEDEDGFLEIVPLDCESNTIIVKLIKRSQED